MSRRKQRQTFECGHCGADVPIGKRVCRECGSDAGTGWQDQDEIDYQSIDIPDGYGPESDSTQLPPKSRSWFLGTVALVVAISILLLALARWF